MADPCSVSYFTTAEQHTCDVNGTCSRDEIRWAQLRGIFPDDGAHNEDGEDSSVYT